MRPLSVLTALRTTLMLPLILWGTQCTGVADVVINEIMYYAPSALGRSLEDRGGEFIELYNSGDEEQSLAGWRISGGVDFSFSSESIRSGEFLVVAADPIAINERVTLAAPALGPWRGRLSNSGETIRIRNERNEVVDEVEYADDGDWARRVRGVVDNGFEGWVWSKDHDGGGKSLELVSPAIDNSFGQAWASSTVNGGSPGAVNGSFSLAAAPLIEYPRHRPEIPPPGSEIEISAVVVPGTSAVSSVMLHYRRDGDVLHALLVMKDDGKSGDGGVGDGVYGVTLPAQPSGTIIEYYISASDSTATRRYPVKVGDDAADLLFQIIDDDSPRGRVSRHFIVMTEKERSELEVIGDFTAAKVDSQMNATFISVSESGTSCRYNVGVKNRGHTSRWVKPHNYRVNFRSDEPWKSVTSIALNGTYAHRQLVGNRIHQLAGLPANDVVPVTLRVKWH